MPRRLLRSVLVGLIALAAWLLIVVVAWGLDLRAHQGEVMRNVELGDRMIGGMTRAGLADVTTSVAEEFDGARIRVSASGGGFATNARSLGVSVAEKDTFDAAFAMGRTGSAPWRFVDWARSVVLHRKVPLRIEIDRAAVYRTVREQDPGKRKEPTEPGIRWEDDEFEVVEGKPGNGIDAADVIDALPDAAAAGSPFIVQVERGDVEPQWSDGDAEELAAQAKDLVDESLQVRAGDVSARLTPATARPWVEASATDEDFVLALDDKKALDGLESLLKDAGKPAVETRFTVEGSEVKIIAGETGTKCCADDAVDLVEQALFTEGRPSSAVELPLTTREPSLTVEEARALGVVEPVGSFRTAHPAGQPRVANIHRIADIVRGAVIEPGESFSVNTFVGRRTTERGFVSAPVIEEGRFSEGVGGGISQFATTLFNAAFFAGLEYDEYQSHSIYISRYPHGREATLNYPKPDLILENQTPYGVVLWPTYDNTSITVTLYSTKHLEAVQSGQSSAPRGNCTRVTTERTRTYEDGRDPEVDRVFATYRPSEGVNC